MPLAQGDLPSGQALSVAGLTTQTDVKTTYADGSARMAVVTCKPTGTAAYAVSAATPPTPSPFSPTLPTSTKVEFSLHTRCVLLGIFSITSGTFSATLTQVTSGKRIVADVVVLVNQSNGTQYILDDADGAVFSTTGASWNTLGGGSDAAGWPGGKTVHWTTTNGATAIWTKTSLPSGTYSVAMSWTDWTTVTQQGQGDPRATVTVKDGATTRGVVEVNQLVASAEFVGRVLLANFTVTSPNSLTAVLNNLSTNGLTVADAVGLYKGGELISVIDDSDAGCAFAGTWLESGVGWPAGYAYGYKNTYRIANWSSYIGDGSSTATYTWTGLATGSDYTLVAWTLFSPFSTAELDITMMLTTTAGWTIKDGATTRGTITVNQRDWGTHDLVETYRAPIPASESADFWLTGNLCREHRSTVAPFFVDSGGTEHTGVTHQTIRVLYDCRMYNDNTGTLQVVVENGLDIAVGTYVQYTNCVTTVNGVTVSTHNDVEQWYGARWTETWPIGAFTAAEVTQDWSRAYAGRILMEPRSTCDLGNVSSGYYNPNIGGRVGADWDPTGPHFTILRRGVLDGDGLAAGGAHPQLGTEPQWCNQFLAHGNADAGDYMLAGGRFAGSYPHHFRDTSTNEPVNCVDRPNVTINYQQSPSSFLQPDALHGQQDLAATRFGRWQMSANTPHNPTISYVPYLYTGERYHQEEVIFWADYPLLSTTPGLREGALCYPNDGAGCRGIGWQVFGYAKGLTVTTDAGTMQDYFTTLCTNGLAWMDLYAAGSKTFGVNNLPYASVLGCAFDLVLGTTLEHLVGMAPWQQIYVAMGIWRAQDILGSSAGGTLLDIILGYLINQHGQYDPAHPDDPAFSTFPFHFSPTMLVNGPWHYWCDDQANTPQNWTIAVGTAGTSVLRGTQADSYVTDGCLKMVSNGATLISVTQQFGTTPSVLAGAGGTPDTLTTGTLYYLMFHLKASSAPTTGTLVVDLIDGSGNPLSGCTTSVALNTLTTSYQRFNASFTTPGSISGTPKFRIRFTVSPDNGRTIYVGDMTFWNATTVQVLETFYSVDALWTTNTVTFGQFTTWDQAATASMVNSRIDQYGVVFGLPVPSEAGGAEYAYVYLLAFNMAEVRGLTNGTARYNALSNDPGNLTYDGFNVVRGLY